MFVLKEMSACIEKTPPMDSDSELIFTLEYIHFKSVTWGKCKYKFQMSNSMCASIYRLSPISAQESSQAVNLWTCLHTKVNLNSLNSRLVDTQHKLMCSSAFKQPKSIFRGPLKTCDDFYWDLSSISDH